MRSSPTGLRFPSAKDYEAGCGDRGNESDLPVHGDVANDFAGPMPWQPPSPLER